MGTNLLGLLSAGATGVLIGLGLLGGALAIQQARRFAAGRYLLMIAGGLTCACVFVFVWSLIVSGSLFVAGMAIGAALGAAVGVAVAFALVLTSQWSSDLHRYASALYTATSYTATSPTSRFGGSARSATGVVPPGYPTGYPSSGYPPSSMPPGVYRDPRWH